MRPFHAALGRSIALVVGIFLGGCAAGVGDGDPAIPADATVKVVTAAEAGGGRGPRGIADTFTTDGTVYAFVSMVWPTGHAAWGEETFESRWYSGDRMVVRREARLRVARSPFNFVSSVFAVNLGPGAARYELYADGRKLAEKSFEIVERSRVDPRATVH